MNLLEREIVIVSGRVLKQCYLYRNMGLTENNNAYIYNSIVISVVITVNYCKCILLLYSRPNSLRTFDIGL